MANDTGLNYLHETPATGAIALGGEAFGLPFDNSYARLPDRFFARLAPTSVAAPHLVKLTSLKRSFEAFRFDARWHPMHRR